MRRIIFTLLLLLVATMPAVAQNRFWCKGFLFEVHGSYSNRSVKLIAADDASYSGTITIPSSVSVIVDAGTSVSGGGQFEVNYDVTMIGENAFAGCTDVTEVILPKTVTTIGVEAFYGCTGLTRVTFGNKYCDIYSRAFAGCTALTSFTLPRNASLWPGVFEGCTGLISVNLPSAITSIPENAFYGCTSLRGITIPSTVKRIESSAFAYCTSLTNVVIPNSVTYFGQNVFYSCTGLTQVTLSKNLSSLGGTFLGCTALTSVDIPLQVTSLDATFKGCTNLTAVNIPPLVKEIGNETFADCERLSHIDLPNSLTRIGSRAFCNTALTSLVLPSTVTRIESNAFDGCTSLMSVTCRNLNPPYMSNSEGFTSDTYGLASLYIPASSVNKYQNANWWKLFENVEGKEAYNTTYDFVSDGLFYLVMPNNTVTVTGGNGYDGELTIPATVTNNGVTYSVTGISSNAFSGSGIVALNLPSTLTTIGEKAFYNCNGLTSLTIPENVTSIGADAFGGLLALSRIVWNARECRNSGIPYNIYGYGKYFGYDYYEYEYYLVEFNEIKTNVTEIIIGDQVKVLPDGLAACSQITSIELPESLEAIGDNAFYFCALLTSVTIPVNVTSIGEHAFCNCDGLTSLTWNARNCPDYGGLYYPVTYQYDPITGYDDNTPDGSSPISQIYIGNQVQTLPGDFARSSFISSIQLPASLRSIGAYAFYNCWNLTSDLVIGDEVTDIGDNAFAGCARVTKLTVGRNVSDIGMGAFGYGSEYNSNYYSTDNVPAMRLTSLTWNARQCETAGDISYSSLTQLLIDDNVEVLPDGFGYRSGQLSAPPVLPSSLRVIGNNVFSYCSWLQELTLPSTVTSIGNNAFLGCNRLSSLTLPDRLKSIGRFAFAYCGNLAGISLPDSLQTIGDNAFSDCSRLLSLFLPASVIDFGNQAFSSCSSIESIVVDAGNTVYDSRDNCNAVIRTDDNTILLTCKNTTIPGSITAIKDYAFYGNSQLTGIDIPSSIVSIGKYAFSCSNLMGITIPNSVTSIGEHAFEFCSRLATVTLSESLDTIQPYTFSCCDSLRSITIPNSVTTIRRSAFSGCSQLSSVVLSESLTTLEPLVFNYCPKLTTMTIPASLTSISRNAFNGSGMREVTVDSNNPKYDSRDNCNAIIETDNNNLYLGFNNSSIPGTVTSVGDSAFYGRAGLNQVIIPNSVNSIGNSAFENCSALSSVQIGSSVRVLGMNSFCRCNELKALVIPNTLDSIGNQAFQLCRKLKDLRLGTSLKGIGEWAFSYCDSLKSVTIPNSTRTIDDYAFFNSRLESLTIGSSVNFIGYEAFYSYYGNLTRINCLAKTPPTISSYSFYYSVYDNATLFVPEASLNDYKTADNWKRFKNIVGIPGAGPGDVDGNGSIEVNDVTALIDLILNGGDTSIYCDVNGDGEVSILDITIILDLLLQN